MPLTARRKGTRMWTLLLTALWLLGGQTPRQEDVQADRTARARQAFERFVQLSGRWTGSSTKGWTETNEFRVIAGRSAVLETSLDAHPGEAMATAFHLDNGRLLLTHYCVAGNQPRLVASGFSADGKTVTFTFLDATNLPSRDTGHMDKVVFRFIDEDHVSSQWTWYQDGREQWMERITSTRQSASPPR